MEKKRNKVIKPTKLLDEPILNPQIQKKKINNGILNNFSFSGLFSLTALLVLILGLGYGGVTVLNEVQKVNLSPINQPPSVQSISSTSIDENSFFDDVESNNTNIASNSDLEKFYRPTELVLPLMTPRDGPISAIDPAISGVYVEDKNSVISESNQEDIIQVKKNPQVIEEDLPSGVAKKVNLRAETILENYTLVENNLTLPLEPPINTKIVVQSIE